MEIESIVKYEPSYLLHFSFDIRDLVEKCEDRPEVEDAESDLNIGKGISFETEDGRLRCNGKLDVMWTLKFKGEDGDAEFVAECSMLGAASCESSGEDEETLKGILAPNLIVFLWGKIRDLIETASMATPLDRMILPAINPVALLNRDDESEEGE